MDNGQLPDFRSFIEQRFHLSHGASGVYDGRVDPAIPASTVFHAICFMGALGLPSLLQCDQSLRTPVGYGWFGHGKSSPGPVVSDSTMCRSLESMGLGRLRSNLHGAYLLGCSMGVSKCPLRSGRLRIGIVDGSVFGRFQASCLEVVGMESMMVDLEEIPKRGKELPASYALLRRCQERFGSGFVDVMLGDGLYLNAPYFNLCLQELHCDALVKTDDATRDIIQDAMGLFAYADQFGDDIVQWKGIDMERLRSYQGMMASGFTLNGVDASLSVAWIREEEIKTGKHHEFWVVASSKYLPQPLYGEEMRELAHWRWDTENDGFKALNQHVHTKHMYSHDSHASEAILLILFMVFNLLGIYLHHCQDRLMHYPGMKQTRVFALRMMRWLMIGLAFSGYG
jgi:hypothetical protein